MTEGATEKRAANSNRGRSGSALVHPQYRADIDGLRAIAVLAVVAFHAFPDSINGGFVGVDVFFVISGFLISTIILRSLEVGSFSLFEFYRRRIRRIFPALLLVLGFSLFAGWFLLLPDEFKQLGKHIASGAAFISNFVLWKEAGYFDNASETKPLLHLWSLSIEEQFYIFWPLLLWAAWKVRKWVPFLIVGITLISFFLNLTSIQQNTASAFYFPQTRFWELLIGAFLAWASLTKRRPNFLESKWIGLLSVAGGLVLVGAFVLTSERNAFPGWWALLPAIGTGLIVASGSEAFLNRKILSSRLLVSIGLISYPLYLWHWPLLSFGRIVSGGELSFAFRVSLVLISVCLAWLTYRFIELPIRNAERRMTRTGPLLLVMIALGGAGFGTYLVDGVGTYSMSADQFKTSMPTATMRDACFEIPYAYRKSGEWNCSFGAVEKSPELFIYGDSHALSLLPTIEKYAQRNSIHAVFAGASGCPPLLGVQSVRGESLVERFNCRKLNERIFEYVKTNKVKAVLLVARWSYYTGGTTRPDEVNYISDDESREPTLETSKVAFSRALKNTVEAYSNIGVHVFVIEDNPLQLVGPKVALRKARALSDSAINRFSVSRDEHARNNSTPVAEIRGVSGPLLSVISFDEVLCRPDICPLVLGNRFLYADSDHLSSVGAELVYPIIERSLLAIKWGTD